MARPLKIFHHIEENNAKRVHTFYTNRIHFTNEELVQAPIEQTARPSRFYRPFNEQLADVVQTPILRFVFDGQKLIHTISYPYGFFPTNRTPKRYSEGGRGIGTSFTRIAFEQLLNHYPPNTRATDYGEEDVSDEWMSLEKKAGLKVGKPYTLKWKYKAVLNLEKKHKQRHE